MNSRLIKILSIISIVISFLSCNSSNQKIDSNNFNFKKFEDSLNINLKTGNFDEIIKTIKNQGDAKLTDSQINTLNNFAIKFIVKYKDLYVKNSKNVEDTIFNGFILNGSKTKFKSRLSQLQKDGEYKFGRLSTMVGIVEGNIGQFSNNEGSIKLLIKPFYEASKLTSLEMHSFDLVGKDPLNQEYNNSYGAPLAGSDIAFKLRDLRKENIEWLGVSKLIKENKFNPVKSYILMGGELAKDTFSNYSHFWFTDNFVISEISILHVYSTHFEFLSEYEKKLNDMKKSEKKIKF